MGQSEIKLIPESVPKKHPVDDAPAVVKHLKEQQDEAAGASLVKILASINLVHSETKISDSAVGACVPFKVSKIPKDDEGDIAAAVATEITHQTGHTLNVLCEEPPQLNTLNNNGKLRWVQVANVLDSGRRDMSCLMKYFH